MHEGLVGQPVHGMLAYPSEKRVPQLVQPQLHDARHVIG